MPAPNTWRSLYFGCSTVTAAQHRDLDLRVEQRQIDAGLHAVERGLILGVEEARIAERHDRGLAAPLDRSAGQFDPAILDEFGQQRLRLRLGQQHRVTKMRPGLLAAQHRGDEQPLVDLQPGLLALPQAFLGGDVLRRRHQAGKLPCRRLHQLVDPHEARPVVGQRVVHRVGMLVQESRPRLAGAIAHIAGGEARGRQRFRHARLVVVHSGTPSAPGWVHVASSGCYYSHDRSQDRPCMSPAADLNFMFDRAAECMPRADLAALQLSRLKSTARARLRQGPACPGQVRRRRRDARTR